MGTLRCEMCDASYSWDKNIWRCSCGGLLRIKMEIAFPIKKIEKRISTLWRYREALPIENDENIVSFGEGMTPLIEEQFNGTTVLLKEDHLFPTGSFKDRGASVLMSKVKELGVTDIVEDSSGNAGAAVAAYAARAGVSCDIYIPATTSSAKLAQIQCYGATLHENPGSREDAANAALSAAEEAYYASHYWNPFFFHGTKTCAFELCEQLEWTAPDTIVVPVGHGTLLLGMYIGFSELLDAGIIERQPKIIAIQSKNCSPLYNAYKGELTRVPKVKKKKTLAEGIAIAEPLRGTQILNAVKDTHGEFIAVNEREIEDAQKEMCMKGHYIEPTAAATIAGLKRYMERDTAERVVAVLTGHGLKWSKSL